MRLLIDQIESSLKSGNYFLSLFTSLTIPDIAGAMDSENGWATKDKYIDWYEKWVRPRSKEKMLAQLPEEMRDKVPSSESPLDGESCYNFRCSLLHQGRAIQNDQNKFDRIIFVEPQTSGVTIHNTIMNDTICIDLKTFCNEIISGANKWLDQAEGTKRFQKNYENFVKRHPNGLKPFIVGVPVIG